MIVISVLIKIKDPALSVYVGTKYTYICSLGYKVGINIITHVYIL